MGDAYPELAATQERVAQVLKQEEERFGETLENGMKMLEGALTPRRQDARRRDGVQALRHVRLSVDLTADIARERGVRVDEAGFEAAMERAARARARRVAVQDGRRRSTTAGAQTAFRGYDTLSLEGTVVALYKDGTPVDALDAGERGVVVLDRTPFYAESGGQVGDRGELAGRRCLTLSPSRTRRRSSPTSSATRAR